MKPSTPLAFSALLSLISAQPMVEKRDAVTDTVTDWVVVTVDVYTTVNGNPPAGSPAANNKHANHVAYHAQNKAAVAQAQPTTSSSPPPAQQPAAQSPPPVKPVQKQAAYVAPPEPSSSAAPAPPTPSTPAEIQAAEDDKQEAVNANQMSINNAHQSSMNVLQNGGGPGGTPASQPPVAAASPPAAQYTPATAPSTPSTPGSGCGSVGGTCSGDVTIYNDQGNGACGWTNDTNSEDFFALAHNMMGEYSNDAPGPHKNSYCGRMANIHVSGKTFTAMLTDKCGGCDGESIDLSAHLWDQAYPGVAYTRFYNVQWEFTTDPVYSEA